MDLSRSISMAALTMALASSAFAQSAAPPVPGKDAPAIAEGISGTYTFDPEHSHIVFKYNHMGFSTSHGLITGVTGKVTLDEANKANSTVEASFPLSAIRTVAPALDKDLMSDEFFKGQTPETLVTFKSTSVKLDDDPDEADVTGDLTLNGVTKPVTLEVSVTEAVLSHPMTGKPVVGFEIEGKIKRSDFNLGAFAPAVSDEVEFDIGVEASK